MHAYGWMRFEPCPDCFCLVRGEVVENQVNLSSLGLPFDDLIEEGNELAARVSLGGHSLDLSGADVESRVEREKTVSYVLESVSLSPARRKGKNRIPPIKSLNGGLLVDAHDDRVLRRGEIKPDDIGRFLLKIRVTARDVALKPMRLEAGTLPDSLHSHVTDTESSSHVPGGPVGERFRRRLLSKSENPGLELGSYSVATAATGSVVEPGHPFLFEAFSPPGDAGRAQVEFLGEKRIGLTVGDGENKASSLRQACGDGTRSADGFELAALLTREH